jgi:hypothetical protein
MRTKARRESTSSLFIANPEQIKFVGNPVQNKIICKAWTNLKFESNNSLFIANPEQIKFFGNPVQNKIIFAKPEKTDHFKKYEITGSFYISKSEKIKIFGPSSLFIRSPEKIIFWKP